MFEADKTGQFSCLEQFHRQFEGEAAQTNTTAEVVNDGRKGTCSEKTKKGEEEGEEEEEEEEEVDGRRLEARRWMCFVPGSETSCLLSYSSPLIHRDSQAS